jgi:tungstate transport system substrate-binding protein
VLLATTTSTAASGLLDALLPVFERESGIEVQFIAVGSGAALRHGRNGDVDLVLSHAPEEEAAFVRDGYGLARVPFAANDFVLLGPAADPASVVGSTSAVEAFTRVAGAAAPFVSRGDGSGPT